MAKTMTMTYGGQTGWEELDAARTERERIRQLMSLTEDTLRHRRYKVTSVKPTWRTSDGVRTYRITFEASPDSIRDIVGIFDDNTVVVTVDGHRWTTGGFLNWHEAGMPMRRGEPVRVDEFGEEIG